ncbi:MAG: hypothetical protein NTU98_09050 [Bacteroidetes bacterium]|nr:hypothetical protein [Bacteroidota bacterium]
MALGFFDVLANIATGGAYSLTKDTVGALAGVAGAIASTGQTAGGTGGQETGGAGTPIAGQTAPGGALGGLGRGIGQGVVYTPATPQKCCCWEISGDYLLNGETGQVWLINKDKMELLPLKKNLSPLENAATAAALVAVKHAMLEQKDTVIALMPFAAREPMTGQVNALIKAFDKEIGK